MEGGAEKSTEIQNPGPGSSQDLLGLKAVLIGATGAVGECVLGEVLASKNFSKVVVLGRREAVVPEAYGIDQKAEEGSGRLQHHSIDFEQLSTESVGEHFKDKSVFFCTLGTTKSKAGSSAAFHHIDHDYVTKCAEIAKETGIPFMSYVSSVGANPNSWIFYLKTKGQVEEALKKLSFAQSSIFRPGLLDRGGKNRFVEKAFGWFTSAIPVASVAKGMRVDAERYFRDQHYQSKEETHEPVSVYGNADILKLCADN